MNYGKTLTELRGSAHWTTAKPRFLLIELRKCAHRTTVKCLNLSSKRSFAHRTTVVCSLNYGTWGSMSTISKIACSSNYVSYGGISGGYIFLTHSYLVENQKVNMRNVAHRTTVTSGVIPYRWAFCCALSRSDVNGSKHLILWNRVVFVNSFAHRTTEKERLSWKNQHFVRIELR